VLDPKHTPGRLVLSIANTPEEVREAQQLRYKVFISAPAMQPVFAEAVDEDEFDEYCHHLTVRDKCTNEVIGTYRFLSPASARRCGRYYSETEFDLSRLHHLRERTAEAGRACIDPRFRSGAVLLLLWRGLAMLLEKERCDYLIGCASVSLADGGSLAASLSSHLSINHLAPIEYRVVPHIAFKTRVPTDKAQRTPPLLSSYLRSGAWIGGAPAWDAGFNCADFFLLLPLARLDQGYANHFFKQSRILQNV
jgi:putative hemolysin